MKKKTENEYMNRGKNDREKGKTVPVSLLRQRVPHTRTYLPVLEFLPSTELCHEPLTYIPFSNPPGDGRVEPWKGPSFHGPLAPGPRAWTTFPLPSRLRLSQNTQEET